jgi:Tfp pilus assembly protein PilF
LPSAFPKGPVAGIARGYYGEFLTLAGKYEEAEQVLSAALADLKSKLGPEHPRTTVVAGFLADLQQARSRPAPPVE